jgi:hypothetical protein
MSVRLAPFGIVRNASSHPLITLPVPTWKVKVPPCAVELSKGVPSGGGPA